MNKIPRASALQQKGTALLTVMPTKGGIPSIGGQLTTPFDELTIKSLAHLQESLCKRQRSDFNNKKRYWKQ